MYSLNGSIKSILDAHSPKTKLIYRVQNDYWQRLPSGMFTTDPVQNATNWMTGIKDDKKRTLLDVWALNPADFFDPLNEPTANTPSEAQWLNTWMMTALELAHQRGFNLALFSFGTANPPYDSWQYLLPAMRLGKQYGAILSLHVYQDGSLLLKNPDGSYAQETLDQTLRHRKIYGQYVPTDAQLPIVYTEASPDNGYGMGLFGQAWVNDMGAYDTELFKDQCIMGICGFQLGGNESNLTPALPAYGEYIRTHPTPIVEDTLNIVVTEHLLPPDTTQDEADYVTGQALPYAQDVMRSADVVKFVVKAGLQGSKAIVWNPERWTQGSIIDYLGVPTEVRMFPNSTPFVLSNPVPAIPFRVTSEFNTPRNYANGLHEGLDLDAYDDTAGRPVVVKCAAQGVVEKVNLTYTANSYGIYVVVRHDFNGEVYKTWYCHLGKAYVKVGDVLLVGDRVGVAGATGTTAIHLHLNLQWIGHGLSGYYVPDVVDPLPYIDQTVVIPPVTGNAWSGLHLRADGLDHNSSQFALEKQCIIVSKVNAVKLMTNSTFESIDALKAMGQDPKKMVLRLFADMANRVVTADEFYGWQTGWLAKFASIGGVYVEVHNEANLPQEGYGKSWQNGAQFATWFARVSDLIHANYPTLKVVYPGLSPQPNVPEFEATLPSLIASGKIDAVGAHSYWVNAADMNSTAGGRYYRRFLTYGKPVLLTEVANVGTSDSDTLKGQQYKSYTKSLDSQVLGVYYFVSSASDPAFSATRQTWIRGTTITDIAYQVGA